MRFQNATPIQVAGRLLRTTVQIPSGSSSVLIPGTTNTLTVSLQQYLLTWQGVTSAGSFQITWSSSDPYPLIVYETVGNGSLVLPVLGEIYTISTYGLRIQNSSTGGTYSVSVWYSITIP